MPHYKHIQQQITGLGNVAGLVEGLSRTHKALGSNQTWDQTPVIPALQRKREAGEFEIQGHTWIHSQFKASLASMKPYLKNIKLWLAILCEWVVNTHRDEQAH